MPLVSFLKTSLIDYPGKVASVVFVGGCNFRCPYCHNGDLVLGPNDFPALHEDVVLDHLKKRAGLIDGLVITGGEATGWKKLPDFLRRAKDEVGVPVKLDTNGSHPDRLVLLLAEGLVDTVAMDLKHHPEAYHLAVGLKDAPVTAVEESFAILQATDVPVLFRTTVVRSLHTYEDLDLLAHWLGSGRWLLQQYNRSEKEIEPGDKGFYSKEEMERMAGRLGIAHPALDITVQARF